MLSAALRYPVRGDGLKRLLVLCCLQIGVGIAAAVLFFGAVLAGIGLDPTAGGTPGAPADPGALASASGLGVGIVVGAVVVGALFVLVGVFVFGYNVRVLGSTITGAEELPPFDGLGRFFRDGIVGAVVSVVYLLPVVAVVVALGSATDSTIALVAIAGALYVSVAYVLPVGLARYATDGVTGAFDLGAVATIATSRGYAVAWALAFVVGLVAGVLNLVVSFVPLVGSLASVVLSLYVSLVGFRLYGRGVADATV